MVLTSTIIALSLFSQRSDLFQEALSLVTASSPRLIVSTKQWIAGSDRDPRIQVMASQMARARWKPDDALARQAQQLAKDIEARPLTGPEDPRIKKIAEITARMSPPAANGEMDHINRRSVYDQETRRWVKSSGYEVVKQWSGRMVLLEEQAIPGSSSGGRYESVSIVDWIAPNRYWDSQSGRMIWSGGYTVRAAIRALGEESLGLRRQWSMPERTIQRDGRNYSQMHLGREGWYIKFSPLGVDVDGSHIRVPLASLSNMLLNGGLLSTIQTSRSIGSFVTAPNGEVIPDSVLLGYPGDLKIKPQSGSVRGSLADGGGYQVSWRFGPG